MLMVLPKLLILLMIMPPSRVHHLTLPAPILQLHFTLHFNVSMEFHNQLLQQYFVGTLPLHLTLAKPEQ
jgi:hypothetical protein